MTAAYGEWHGRAATTAESWMKLRRADAKANTTFMDLLHDSTLAGVDPSTSFKASPVLVNDPDAVEKEARRRSAHTDLSRRFSALPPGFQKLWGTVRSDYDALGDAFDAAILKNIETATEVGQRRAQREHAKRIREIADEGLEGPERAAAIAEADERLA